MKIYHFFLLILILIPSTVALGVTPSKNIYDYVPGETYKGYFVFINDQDFPITGKLNASGRLSEFLSYEGDVLTLSSHGRKKVEFTLIIPDDLPYGENKGYLWFKQNPNENGGMFGTQLRIGGLIKVFRPYPGEYAKFSLSVPNVAEGQPVSYKATINNKGTSGIEDSSLEIEFMSSDGNLIHTEIIKDIDIASQEVKVIEDYIKGVHFSKGEYVTNALYRYNEEIMLNRTFTVGSYEMAILNYSNEVFSGIITPFTVTVKSNWNSQIKDVYVEVEINKKTYQSHLQTFGAFSEKEMVVYIDDKTFKEGQEYPAKIKVFFGDTSISKDITLTGSERADPEIEEPNVQEKGSFFTSTTTIMFLTIVILVLINLFVLFYKRRKEV